MLGELSRQCLIHEAPKGYHVAQYEACLDNPKDSLPDRVFEKVCLEYSWPALLTSGFQTARQSGFGSVRAPARELELGCSVDRAKQGSALDDQYGKLPVKKLNKQKVIQESW